MIFHGLIYFLNVELAQVELIFDCAHVVFTLLTKPLMWGFALSSSLWLFLVGLRDYILRLLTCAGHGENFMA